MERLAVWLVGVLLRRSKSISTRSAIVIHILDSLQVIPLSAIIDTNANGELTISGRTLDIEMGRVLLGHARNALDNKALNLIRQQVLYEAFVGSATKANSPEDLLFYKAAIWWGQREEYFLKQLAQSEEPTL